MNALYETRPVSSPSVASWASRPVKTVPEINHSHVTLIDQLLLEQRTLTAVEKFARNNNHDGASREKLYRDLIPLRGPQAGEQYAFTVDLDKCSGCKACVSACHSLNGLDDSEVWRKVGLLISTDPARTGHAQCEQSPGIQQHVTTACHHCVEPACLEGCPVLAYDKDEVTGIVRHLDDQCIGCNYCVMKCPYEVPKYSSRLGIVRKCDMCADRLAVGEAPACAQACPSAAIQITLVKPAEIKAAIRRAPAPAQEKNAFLADSPDPRITLPTTQFVSRQGLSASLFAADRGQPRLDEPHWPLAMMLLLTQSATGMFVAAGFALTFGVTSGINRLLLGGFATFVAGLSAAGLHLGQPFRAWRCFLGWRKSWLSREIIIFNVLGVVATPVVVVALIREYRLSRFEAVVHTLQPVFAPLTVTTVFVGVIAVFTSAMVYVDTKRPFWSARKVFGNFFGTAFLLGAACGAIVMDWRNASPRTAKIAIIVALVIQAALFIWRWAEYVTALRDPKSPIHLNARAISELLPRTPQMMVLLFGAAMVMGVLAMGNVLHAALMWMTFATMAMFGSELLARHTFFVASAGKRMPGGVTA